MPDAFSLSRLHWRTAGIDAIPATTSLGLLHLDDRQREAQFQFVPKINLDVVQSELLELHATEIMDVGGVAFHFLQVKSPPPPARLLGVIRADNLRALMKSAGAAAPARPDAKPHVIHRQLRRGDDVEHADQRLHAVEFAAHIFTQHAALEIG